MNCTSAYNQCASCGPEISIFYKSVSMPISLYGFAPFQNDDGQTRYLSQMKKNSYSDRTVSVLGECCVRPFGPQGYTCAGAKIGTRYTYTTSNGNSNEIWSHIIDECGNIIADNDFNGFTFLQQQSWIPNDDDDQCRNYSSNVSASKTFGELIEYTYGGTCAYPSLPAGGSEVVSATTMKTANNNSDSSQDNCMVVSTTENLDELGTTVLSNSKNLSYFQNIYNQAASKALVGKNSEDNNNPCISYAGWSTAWDTGNKDSEINALKIRIAVLKDNFKEYSSIGGTYYLYYGGQVGESPCCQSCGAPECFTGTIVKTVNFSLGQNTDEELPGYFVASALEVNNYSDALPLNQGLKFCYTIKNIK
jgi:hypothetical protein